MTKHGKKYRASLELIDHTRTYSPEEAVDLAKKSSYVAFDETVELHLRTNADPRHADQMIRGATVLPHGLGKTTRVLVFAQGDGARRAESAGADHVGGEELVAKIENGWLEFDVVLATPDLMSKIGKLGRVLGRKGLMPNPRTGTVVQSEDLPRAIEEAKKGRVEFRLDRTSVIHVTIGKVSFSEDALKENLATLVSTIIRQRPSGVKGEFIRSAYLTTAMGPSIKLDLSTTLTLTEN
jgi:large subunit ribosomal protein L1